MKDTVVGPIATSAVAALAMGAVRSIAGAEDDGAAIGSQRDPSRFAYARLYCTADNQSHFGAVAVELAKRNFAPPAHSR